MTAPQAETRQSLSPSGLAIHPRFLYSIAETTQRQRLTDMGRVGRSFGSVLERGRTTLAGVATHVGIAHNPQILQDALVFHNRERFEVPNIVREDRTSAFYKTEFDSTLKAIVSENNNEGALKSLYREVLHLYTKEIAYFVEKGETGKVACQALFSELVQFGLRGEVARALALKQKGMDNGGSGAKDIELFDKGVMDELFLSIIAITEVDFTVPTFWISTNRSSKHPDDLRFIDIALRYRTPLKGLIVGDAYYDTAQYKNDRVGDLNGLMRMVEALPASDWSNSENVEKTMQTQLFAFFLLNPQLFLKFVDMFKEYPHVLGDSEIDRQRAKQDIRDADFEALKAVGHRVSLLKGKVIPPALLDFVKSITEQDLFSFAKEDTEVEGKRVKIGRTTTLLGMMTAMREITKAMDRRREGETIAEQKVRAAKNTRNGAFPMTRITKQSNEAIPAMKMFGEEIVLPLLDKAIGSMESGSGVAHAGLLNQLLMGVTYFSPDSFIAEVALQPLRKEYGAKLIHAFHLIFNSSKAIKDNEGTLNVFKTIFQYIYQHWPVEDVKGVIDTYDAVTIGNSNARAFTGGRLSAFLFNISLPNAEQHIEFDQSRFNELTAHAGELLIKIAGRSEVFFGGTSGTSPKLDYRALVGVGDVEANLRGRLDGLESSAQPALKIPSVDMISSTGKPQEIQYTLDIWEQIVEVAKFIPQTAQKRLAPTILDPLFGTINRPYSALIAEDITLPITERLKVIAQRVPDANDSVARATGLYNAAVSYQTELGSQVAEAEASMAKRVQESIKVGQGKAAEFQTRLQAQIHQIVETITAMAGAVSQPAMQIGGSTALPAVNTDSIMEIIRDEATAEAISRQRIVDLETGLRTEIIAIADTQKRLAQMTKPVTMLQAELEKATAEALKLRVTLPNTLNELITKRLTYQAELPQEQARLLTALKKQLRDIGFGLLLDWNVLPEKQ